MANATKTGRTKADEVEYVANLKREEPIKTQVIVELREQNRNLWTSQARILQALLDAEAALRVYREVSLQQARLAADDPSPCRPGCKRHRWDDVDGWHDTTPKGTT